MGNIHHLTPTPQSTTPIISPSLVVSTISSSSPILPLPPATSTPLSSIALKNDEELIPVMFRWTQGGGQKVRLTGNFNNWEEAGIPMVRSGQEFFQVLELPRGLYQYKFLVDGEWKCANDQPTLVDDQGIANNQVDVLHYETYLPPPMVDPLDSASYEDFTCNLANDALPSVEPSTVPILLIKSILGHFPDSNNLFPHNPAILVNDIYGSDRPLLPPHSICSHVFHDSGNTFKKNCIVWSSLCRFKEKIAVHLLVTLTENGCSQQDVRNDHSPATSDELEISSNVLKRMFFGVPPSINKIRSPLTPLFSAVPRTDSSSQSPPPPSLQISI